MKNILVPVDFSELSKVAARYALGLAETYHCNVHLFAVQDINSGPHALMNKYKLEAEMDRATREDGAALLRQMQALLSNQIKITFATQTGYPIHSVIETYVHANHIDLIVMGSKGATGLKKVVLGSNAAAVINHSIVPVIVVPGSAVYKGIKSIVYATDMRHLDHEIHQINELVNDFDAKLHIIHVVPEGTSEEMNSDEPHSANIKTISYATDHFHVFKSTPVAETIDDFVLTHQADLLALFTHKLEFFEKLLDTSVTRQLAFHSHVPLLSFNKTTTE